MTRPTGPLKDWVKAKEKPSELLADIQVNMLAEYSKPDPDRMTGVLHPSQMAHGNWCQRASYYELSGVAPSDAREIPGFQLQNIFENGHDRHKYWQGRVRDLGILYGVWHCPGCLNDTAIGPEPSRCPSCGAKKSFLEYAEVPVDGRERHGIYGRGDGLYLRKDGSFGLLEIKTIGIGTLRMDVPDLVIEHTVKTVDGRTVIDVDSIWRGLHRPLPPHLRQTNIYAKILNDSGINVTAITFLYEYKANQAVKEFTVTPSDRIADTLLDKADRVVTAVDKGAPLPRFDGARKDRKPCSECRWRTTCYEGTSSDGEATELSGAGTDTATTGDVDNGVSSTPRVIRRRRYSVQ